MIKGYRKNAEEFIIRTARLINEQKATAIIEPVTDHVLHDRFGAKSFMRNAVTCHMRITLRSHYRDEDMI